MKKRIFSLIGFLFLLIVIFLIPFRSSDIILEMQYADEAVSGVVAELFWKTEKEGFSGENVFKATVIGAGAQIKLSNTCSDAVQYRVDFVNIKEKWGIAGLSLWVDGTEKWKIDGEEIIKYIAEMDNVSFKGIEDGNARFEAVNDDPIVIFNDSFTNMLNSGIKARSYKKNIVGAVILLVLSLLVWNRRVLYKLFGNKIYRDFEKDNNKVFWYFLIILIGISVFVFWQFIIGEKLYIFKNGDIGSDSINQTYPELVYLAKEISHGNLKEGWNHNSSLGNVRELIFPTLNNWVTFFGSNNVAYLLGVSQFLKVLLAGLLFYFYLCTVGISRGISSVFALCYAYGAQIILRGRWQTYPNETVLFAVWLLGFERFYVKKDYKWLPVVTGIFFLNFSGYYLIFYMGIFVAYDIFRYCSDCAFKKTCLKEQILFVLSMVIGIMISSVTSLPSVFALLFSDRFKQSTTALNVKFEISSWLTIRTAYLRSIGTMITGISNAVGFRNILEGPTFYCGLLTILVVPMTIFNFNEKRKYWYLFGVFIVCLYVIVKPIWTILNGMQNTFKLASLWVIVLLLFLAAQGLECLRKRRLKIWEILLISSMLIVLGIVCYIEGSSIYLLGISVIIIICYSLLLWAVNRKMTFATFNMIVLLFCVGEVGLMSYYVINGGDVVTNEESEGRLFYNDYTIEAQDYLEKIDRDYYRIDKDFESVSLADSLYQGYKGTKGYIGGKGDRNLTGEFYKVLGFPGYSASHFMWGFGQSTAINTLLNVKYILTKNVVSNYGYEKLAQEGDVQIYENQNTLPLGFTYSEYISREKFEQLTIAQKRNVMMKAVVIENEQEMETVGIKLISDEKILDNLSEIDELKKYQVDFIKVQRENSLIVHFEPVQENEVAVIKMKVNNNDNVLYVGSWGTITGDVIEYGDEMTLIGQYYNCFVKGRDEYIYEFNVPATEWVQFNITNSMQVDDMEIYIMPKSIYYKSYLENVVNLSNQSMELSNYSDSRISGEYVADADQILFFSIPYDENWHLYIDGEEIPIIHANIGFMGAYVESGDHSVVLEYKGRVLYCILSVCGCIILVFYMTGCVIQEKKKKKFENEGKKENNDKDISGSSCL